MCMAHDCIDFKHDNMAWDHIVFNMIIITIVVCIQDHAILDLYRHR